MQSLGCGAVDARGRLIGVTPAPRDSSEGDNAPTADTAAATAGIVYRRRATRR